MTKIVGVVLIMGLTLINAGIWTLEPGYPATPFPGAHLMSHIVPWLVTAASVAISLFYWGVLLPLRQMEKNRWSNAE